MAASQNQSQLLQFQLANALQSSWLDMPLPTPPSLLHPYFEQENEKYRHIVQKRAHNQVLESYLALAKHYHEMGMKLTKTQASHRIAKFLWDYYKDYPTAIQQLEGVTPRAIERLTNDEKKRIVRERPTLPKPSRIDSGRTNNWTDELWRVVEDNEDLPSLQQLEDDITPAQPGSHAPPLGPQSNNRSLVISHRRLSHASHPYKRATTPANPTKPQIPSGVRWIELDGHIDLTQSLDFPI
jgi:hypothetical protein